MKSGIELVVGLGNPGAQYENTRHNIGYMILDRKARAAGFRFHSVARALVARHGGVYFMKPLTFMNLSGEAVGPFCRQYRIPASGVLVVADDLDLAPGQIRIRKNGSSGGHNGLRSIMEALGGSYGFPRLRVGIGRPPERVDAVEWVLSRFPRAERAVWEERLGLALSALDAVLDEGIEVAMNRFNGRD